jgi:hypothetical protein
MATVDRRLWLTEDAKLVEDGDPAAATLWAAEGREVSDAEADRVGYKPRRKGADKPEDKARRKAEDKGR